MRRGIPCFALLLALGSACGLDSSVLEVECKSSKLPAGTQDLAVFEGKVTTFVGRRLRVVNGDLHWGAESFGAVKRGDKVEFTDAGWSVNGEVRKPIGIELELHQNGGTVKFRLEEQTAKGAENDNRVGDVHWYFFDETLHVNDRAFGPIRPGDSVRVEGNEVWINGRSASPR